jgi:hypothetical protein
MKHMRIGAMSLNLHIFTRILRPKYTKLNISKCYFNNVFHNSSHDSPDSSRVGCTRFARSPFVCYAPSSNLKTGWFVSLKTRMAGWKNRAAGWFIDREFFMRANGQVRFLKISARLQRRAAGTLASVLGLWLVVTFGMAINQVTLSAQRVALRVT